MKRLVLAMIHGYQRWVSPLKKPCCRYIPTCSAYAVQAVERFGVVKGLFLALCRILRCNPFHPGGYDPVPEQGESLLQYLFHRNGKRNKNRN